jgi:hypothetical protein
VPPVQGNPLQRGALDGHRAEDAQDELPGRGGAVGYWAGMFLGALVIDELRTLVHGERGSVAAIKGSHDDRVMALSLANIGAQQTISSEIVFL